ncbi:hypothetical protein LY78DRAFT_664475 [Colletotrichum sublineola]|nr:hypothetical protein LY78DRAFT_664475 [Colletotrichum sublineola]
MHMASELTQDSPASLSAFVALVNTDRRRRQPKGHIAAEFHRLESDLASSIHPIDLRAQLPLNVVSAIINDSHSDDFTPFDSQIPAKLRKATRYWGLDPSACIFLLDALNRGRPFFVALLTLASICHDWDKASSSIRSHAQRRRAQTPGKRAVPVQKSNILHAIDDLQDCSSDLARKSPEPVDYGSGDTDSDVANSNSQSDDGDFASEEPAGESFGSESEVEVRDNDSSELTHFEYNRGVESELEDTNSNVAESDPNDQDTQHGIGLKFGDFSQDMSGLNLGLCSELSIIVNDDQHMLDDGSQRPQPSSPEDPTNVSGDSPQPPLSSSTKSAHTPENAVQSVAIPPPQDSLESQEPMSKRKQMASAPSDDGTLPKRRQEHDISQEPAHASLVPSKWVKGVVILKVLYCLCNLFPDEVIPLEASSDEHRVPSPSQAATVQRVKAGLTTLIPFNDRGHWSLAVAKVTGRTCMFNMFDSLETNTARENRLFAEAKARVTILLGDGTPGHEEGTVRHIEQWESAPRHGIRQTNNNDCGVAIVVHSFYSLANMPTPRTIDWILWRRITAVLVESDLDTSDSKPIFLDIIRTVHRAQMGIGQEFQVIVRPSHFMASLIPPAGTGDLASPFSMGIHDVEAVLEHGRQWFAELESNRDAAKDRLWDSLQLTKRTLNDARRILANLIESSKKAMPAPAVTDQADNTIDRLQGILDAGVDSVTQQMLLDRVSSLQKEIRQATLRATITASKHEQSLKSLGEMEKEMDGIEEEISSVERRFGGFDKTISR